MSMYIFNKKNDSHRVISTNAIGATIQQLIIKINVNIC